MCKTLLLCFPFEHHALIRKISWILFITLTLCVYTYLVPNFFTRPFKPLRVLWMVFTCKQRSWIYVKRHVVRTEVCCHNLTVKVDSKVVSLCTAHLSYFLYITRFCRFEYWQHVMITMSLKSPLFSSAL